MRARMLSVVACAVAVAGCGQGVDVPENDPLREGAQIFTERCSGCHSLDVAGAQGSEPAGNISNGERTNGPNFNVRLEERDDVLYAIRNGGFSGAIMPANIVVGEDAEKVADFLAAYAGKGEADQEGSRDDSGEGSAPD